jgi:hypothetical protein
MTQTVTLDGKKLQQIANASHSATVAITALALRERLRHFSDINRTKTQLIREGEKIVDSDYMKMWKDLQEAGVGSIVYGRKGKPDRFEWHYSLKKVAKSALEGTNEEVHKLVPEKKSAKQAKPTKVIRRKLSVEEKSQRANQSDAMNIGNEKLVFIPLRKGFNLEFTLPRDFSRDEAEIISQALHKVSA